MSRTAALLLAALLAAGCTENKPVPAGQGSATAAGTGSQAGAAHADEADVKANLARLSPEDRALAEKQKYCVEQPDERLGSMGVPVKLTIQGEAVFLCCKSCQKHALKDPDKTLQKARELREKNK